MVFFGLIFSGCSWDSKSDDIVLEGETPPVNESPDINIDQSVKKTGQAKSYDEDGNEVADGTLKDDGFYQKGSTPKYTRTSDIVTDVVTGLMWQDDEAVKTVKKLWQIDGETEDVNTSGDTATTYCKELTLGGYSDWRLPSSTELEGIVDYSKENPAMDDTFKNVNLGSYWSSTVSKAGWGPTAWYVHFQRGTVDINARETYSLVRCVRGSL